MENIFDFLPDKCDKCGHPTTFVSPELFCSNDQCPERLFKTFVQMVSAFEIKGLAESTLRKMYFQGTSFHPDGVDPTTKNAIELFINCEGYYAGLEGFAATSGANLYRVIQAASDTTDYQVLASLAIEGVGTRLSQMILSEVTLDELIAKSEAELQLIPNIGPDRAAAIFNGLKKHHDYLRELLMLVNAKQTKQIGEKKNEGIIVFTGESEIVRSELVKLAESNGYKVGSSVSSKTTLLVCSDPDSGSGKAKKAKTLGVKTMLYSDWLKTIGATSGSDNFSRSINEVNCDNPLVNS